MEEQSCDTVSLQGECLGLFGDGRSFFGAFSYNLVGVAVDCGAG